MKNKPTIYKQNNSYYKTNNKEYCYVVNTEDTEDSLNRIAESLGPLQQKKVHIKTKEKDYVTYIYRREQDRIITTNYEVIPIKDIILIKRIS